jgi:hypothetical protein
MEGYEVPHLGTYEFDRRLQAVTMFRRCSSTYVPLLSANRRSVNDPVDYGVLYTWYIRQPFITVTFGFCSRDLS